LETRGKYFTRYADDGPYNIYTMPMSGGNATIIPSEDYIFGTLTADIEKRYGSNVNVFT